jgi:hypothetical protein
VSADPAGLAAADELIVQVVLRQLDALEQEVSKIEAAIVALGKDLPGLSRVLQLPDLQSVKRHRALSRDWGYRLV